MNIADRIKRLQASIPGHVRIVAVSKTKTVSSIKLVYETGQRIFGENRVQELVTKQSQLPASVEWHFIGHLQTNKVRHIAPFISLIHSIDSLGLLREVNREALKNDRVIDCLLQFHIAVEQTKFGLNIEEAKHLLDSEEYRSMKNIRITGVMGMGSFTGDTASIRQEFRKLKEYFLLLRSAYFQESESFTEISMGMSGDYQIAIEEGSTMIRIGTFIFGER